MGETYSQAFLDNLIKTPKKIIDPPTKAMKLEGKHYRNDFKVESRDGKFQFKVFLGKTLILLRISLLA